LCLEQLNERKFECELEIWLASLGCLVQSDQPKCAWFTSAMLLHVDDDGPSLCVLWPPGSGAAGEIWTGDIECCHPELAFSGDQSLDVWLARTVKCVDSRAASSHGLTTENEPQILNLRPHHQVRPIDRFCVVTAVSNGVRRVYSHRQSKKYLVELTQLRCLSSSSTPHTDHFSQEILCDLRTDLGIRWSALAFNVLICWSGLRYSHQFLQVYPSSSPNWSHVIIAYICGFLESVGPKWLWLCRRMADGCSWFAAL